MNTVVSSLDAPVFMDPRLAKASLSRAPARQPKGGGDVFFDQKLHRSGRQKIHHSIAPKFR
jgi:hypothetical protein